MQSNHLQIVVVEIEDATATSTTIRIVKKASREDAATTGSRIAREIITGIVKRDSIIMAAIAVITAEVVAVTTAAAVEVVEQVAPASSRESDRQARACRNYHLKVKHWIESFPFISWSKLGTLLLLILCRTGRWTTKIEFGSTHGQGSGQRSCCYKAGRNYFRRREAAWREG